MIGALALVAWLGTALMHGSMMSSGMMGGGMMGGGAAAWVLGLLVIAGVVAAIVLLSRRSRSA